MCQQVSQSIIASPKKVVLITKAIVTLHKFLISITEDNYNYCPTNFAHQDGPNGLVRDKGEEIVLI